LKTEPQSDKPTRNFWAEQRTEKGGKMVDKKKKKNAGQRPLPKKQRKDLKNNKT